VAALSGPNLLRSIEEWLRIGGLDLGVRGPLFEQHSRIMLAASNALPNVRIAPDSIDLGELGGDVDLCIQIGATILIGEVKCSLFPASPLEDHNYERILAGAAGQAARKAALVAEDPITILGAQGFSVEQGSPVRVHPFVLTNLPLGAGRNYSGVPVVDLAILNKYFGEGYLDKYVSQYPDGHVERGKRVVFYANYADAALQIRGYLESPPQIVTLREISHERLWPLLVVAGSHTISMRGIEVRIPESA
jgi:hypothetical protein